MKRFYALMCLLQASQIEEVAVQAELTFCDFVATNDIVGDQTNGRQEQVEEHRSKNTPLFHPYRDWDRICHECSCSDFPLHAAVQLA